LRWLLHPHQRECYDRYREWEKRDPTQETGDFARLFVLDIGRRWGKTTLRVLTRIEDCIRNPGRTYRYVTAFQKDIEDIIDGVSRVLLETCPIELKPRYKLSAQGQSAGFYFPNGSVLKLAGLDKNPDALRGRASDGDDISEAVFVSHLRYAIKSVLYPQYQGRPWARLCLESSAPEGPDTEYDEVFVADAKARSAYYSATIDDNTALPEDEREEFIRAAGGRDHPDCQREYFCIRNRNPQTVLVPEFDRMRHVRRVEMPEYLDAYTMLDPGSADMFGLVGGYWHYDLQKFVVMWSWAEFNAGTSQVAAAIRENELRVWGDRKRWDGKAVVSCMLKRVSDTDKRLVYDMALEHKLEMHLASKNDLIIDGKHESTLKTLRNWHLDDKIIYDPDCGPVLEHVTHGKWNERRTDWERHPKYGHFDCLAALKYGPRHIECNRNPTPPAWVLDPTKMSMPHHRDKQRMGDSGGITDKTRTTLQRVYGGKPAWRQ
jgi:hypothetical protein